MTFYFAWVNPGVAFSAGTHSVQDEDVYSFDMNHGEGEFAELRVVIRNPRANLLDPSRKLWAWLSVDGDPIFYGRLVAAPDEIQAELITLNFIARPDDYNDQKEALADTLRVLPYYDPVWLNTQRLLDPDVVLETRTALWHVDRVTHVLTASDITTGDTIEEFTTADHFYDDVNVQYGEAPLRTVNVTAKVAWDQTAVGVMDITKELIDAFGEAGSPDGVCSSYTGQGLQDDWPQTKASLHGGWEVGVIELKRVDGKKKRARFKFVKVDNITTPQTDPAATPGQTSTMATSQPLRAQFFIWEFRPIFGLAYDITRKRIETVTFTLDANVQPIVVDAGEDEVDKITLSSQAVGEIDPTDPYSEPPIGDLRYNSYFKTERGHSSLENLMLLARAKLISRARCVNVTFVTTFERGLELSCRKSARVFDPRLPGGEVVGKIVKYNLVADGNGARRSEVVIACTIGEGDTLAAPDAGTPTYVVTGYVDEGYQIFVGGQFTLTSSDLNYGEYLDTIIPDDGLDLVHLSPTTAIVSLQVFNGEDDQAGVLSARFPDIPAAVAALNEAFTEVELVLVNMKGGPFQTDFVIDVSQLEIAKTIEL